MEDLFDYLPTSSPLINQFSDSIFNPVLPVVANDCGTMLGTIIDLSPSSEGLIDLSTDEQLDQVSIVHYLSNGIYKLATRDLHSCTAIGGICQRCYSASFPKDGVPTVGTTVKVKSNYVAGVDRFTSNGNDLSFGVDVTTDMYDDSSVYFAGALQPKSAYTLTDLSLTLNSPQPIGTYITAKFIKYSAKPYFGYVANTYSGSVLGIMPLPTSGLTVRPSLIRSLINDGIIQEIITELSGYSTIDPSYLTYANMVKDPLEKALFLFGIYGIYANISV